MKRRDVPVAWPEDRPAGEVPREPGFVTGVPQEDRRTISAGRSPLRPASPGAGSPTWEVGRSGA